MEKNSLISIAFVTHWGLPELHPDDKILATVLRQRGIRVDAQVWNDVSVLWNNYQLIIIRSTWDYSDNINDFLAWAEKVSASTTLLNSFDILKWNFHKSYLLDLARAKIPIVPTHIVSQSSPASLIEVLDIYGWQECVIKPAIGAGARGVGRFTTKEISQGETHLEILLKRGDVLIQPFISAINTLGEISIMMVDTVLTHTVRKIPTHGDFRVHRQYGGIVMDTNLPPRTIQLRECVNILPTAPLYARLDIVKLSDGQWVIMEFELIEPSLFLGHCRKTLKLLADAIIRRLDRVF